MFSRVRRFIQQHRRKLFFASTLTIASLFLLIRHLHSLFLNHQKRLAEERFNREQIRRRFEQTQKDALFTIWALVPVLGGAVSGGFGVEAITGALRARRRGGPNNLTDDNNSISGLSSSASALGGVIPNDNKSLLLSNDDEFSKKSKNELWDELKSQSLTKILTLIYSNALLVIFTRLQLNILARREYLEDALKIASSKHGFKTPGFDNNNNGIGSQIELIDKTSASYVNEQAYLSFSWWLLNRGWVSLKDKVKGAVDEVFSDINARAELTIDEFAVLLNKTQRLIERNEVSNNNNNDFGSVISDEDTTTTNTTTTTFIGSVLLPPRNLETFVMQQILDEETIEILQNNSTDLRILIDETTQYVNSSSSLIVLSSLVNAGITTFLDQIVSSTIKPKDEASIHETKLKLAVLLASATKASNDFKRGEHNEFIAQMDSVSELDELSASVYSNFE